MRVGKIRLFILSRPRFERSSQSPRRSDGVHVGRRSVTVQSLKRLSERSRSADGALYAPLRCTPCFRSFRFGDFTS